MGRHSVTWPRIAIGVALFSGALLGSIAAQSVSSASSAPLLVLKCSDSAGQQGKGQEVVVGGVEGLTLPTSSSPSGLEPIRASNGRPFLIYKTFLAVSSSVSPFATVSILSPSSASLVYGSSERIGALSSSPHGEALVHASATGVRLAVCGSRFTGYVGGIIIAHPACVTFAVSSSHRRTVKVVEPIGTRRCGR